MVRWGKSQKKVALYRSLWGLCLFSLGCGGIGGGGGGGLEGTFTRTPTDFGNTQIIADSAVPADGTSELLVAVHLKNSDNTPVPNFQPTYTIASGSGVTPSNCTTSDSNGISACILKATVPGTKTVRLTNAKVGLEKDVVFNAPTGSQKLSLIPGLVHGTTAQGDVVQFSIGQSIQGGKVQTVDGYQVKLGVVVR